MTIDAPTGGILRASLDHLDALAADNEAFAVLEPIRPAVVWLVSNKDGSFFFEHALASMEPLVWTQESLTLLPEQYEEAAASAAAAGSTIKHPDLVIFNGWSPARLPPAGRFLVVNACPGELGAMAADPITAPTLHPTPAPHALMQNVVFAGSRLAKAQRVTLSQPAKVLVHSEDNDPLIALFEQPGRQTLLLAFDVLDSDMPFRNAFPLLLRNTVSFMHEDSPSWLRTTYRLGEPIRPLRALPDGVSQVSLHVLHGGEAHDEQVAVRDHGFTFSDTVRAGAVQLAIDGEASSVAINIGDASESRIAPTASSEDAASKLGISHRLLGGMPWIMLALLASVGVLFEWLSYHYRWTE